MLDAIRKRSGSTVVKVLLLFLVLSFGAWGIGDYIGGGVGNKPVATIGNRAISQQAFSSEFQREMNRLRQVFGDNLDADTARSLGIPQSVLNRMIRTEIFAAAAQDMGLVVTDQMVLREIQSMNAFRGVTGNFDKDIFRQAVNNAGYTEDAFLALMRDDMNHRFLLESFTNGAVVPDALLKTVYDFRDETRAAEIVLIPDEASSDVAEPTEEEIASYHQEHADQFMAPAYRSLTYVFMSAADQAKEMAVTDEEILNAYTAREGEFVQPARRNVEQAIFPSREEADIALALIAKSGRTFSDVAAELTGTNADALSLGWVGRDDFISPELADSAFSLTTAGISPAIESPLGWHVLHVVGAEEETRQPLSDVRDKVRDGVAMDKAIDTLYSLANTMEDHLGGGATLEEASQSLNLPLVHIEAVDETGRNPAGTTITVPSPELLSTAFATQEGSESPLTETANNAYFIVRVDSVIDPVLRPLDEVRDAVASAILADRRKMNAESSAKGVVDAINKGATLLDALAKASLGSDMAIVNAASFKRTGEGAPEEMPQELSANLFGRAVGQGDYARAEGATAGFVVGRVSGVTMADIAADQAGSDNLNAELVNGIRSDLLDQLATALQDEYTISINENVLAQIF